MANSKISALISATTPLAGTEVLPIVQSSTTKQVAISDVTAGRAVSGASFAVTGTSLPTTGIYAPSANTLGFAGGSTIRGVIYSVGLSVGNISTISDFSGSVMQVYADAGSAARIKLITATSGTTSSDGASITFDTSNNLTLLNREAGDVVFGTSAVEGARLVNSTGNFTLASGNFVPSTAAKGVNFTANTPASGMTSQLLNWYEEGTWTPTDASPAGLIFTNTSGNCYYTRTGNVVTATVVVTFPVTVSTSSILIGGLPFTSKATTNGVAAVAISYSDYGAGIYGRVTQNATTFTLFAQTTTGSTLTNVNMSTKSFRGTIVYLV